MPVIQITHLFVFIFQPSSSPPNQSWVLAIISLCLSMFTFGVLITKHFGWVPKSRLKLELADSSSDNQRGEDIGFYGHGWIENPNEEISQNWKPEEDKSRIRAYFARARVSNLGRFTANSITLSLTEIRYLDDRRRLPIKAGQPLRWSDSWAFEIDNRKLVIGGDGLTTLPTMPAKAHRYCDLCFHYDLNGPNNMGRFLKDRVYFAVGNLPSQTYALENGEYEVDFDLIAENCKAVNRTYRVSINLDPKRQPYTRVIFKEKTT